MANALRPYLNAVGSTLTAATCINLFTQFDPDNMLRPDLLLPFLTENGLYTLLDVCCTDPRNMSNCIKAAMMILISARRKADAKVFKYEAHCHRAGYNFFSFCIEIFGSMTEESIKLIRTLVVRAADRSHIPYSILLPYWIKRISMNIQKGNAKYFMKSTVRMTSSDTLRDASILLATHHIRNSAE